MLQRESRRGSSVGTLNRAVLGPGAITIVPSVARIWSVRPLTSRNRRVGPVASRREAPLSRSVGPRFHLGPAEEPWILATLPSRRSDPELFPGAPIPMTSHGALTGAPLLGQERGTEI